MFIKQYRRTKISSTDEGVKESLNGPFTELIGEVKRQSGEGETGDRERVRR